MSTFQHSNVKNNNNVKSSLKTFNLDIFKTELTPVERET